MSDNRKIIALFSSDAHPLYKADVFRALALPTGYTLQFRYKKYYLNQDILTRLGTRTDSLVNQDGCIFFVSGNDQTVPKAERQLVSCSIREVKIIDVYDDPKTEQVLFLLGMGDFVDYKIHEDEESGPNFGKYVSDITVAKGIKNSWINRIDAIKNSFPDQLFFNINEVRKSGEAVSPAYSAIERGGYFSVDEESTYQLPISFYDLRDGSSKLKVENLSDSLTLYSPQDFSVNAPQDTQTFSINTASLIRDNQVAFVRLGEKDSIDIYNVELKFLIERGPWKPWVFGVLTTLAAFGLLCGQLFSKKVPEIQELLTLWHFVIGILVLLSVFFSSVFLFKLFNKK